MKLYEGSESCITRSTIVYDLLFTKHYMCDQIKEDEMGGTYSTEGALENAMVYSENLKEINHMGHLDIAARLILS
jgi:hypothetical protein